MIKGVSHAYLELIWYHSETLDVPYSLNQFLGWDFVCRFLQQTGSRSKTCCFIIGQSLRFLLYILVHTVASWTFHKVSGFARVILKGNFKQLYRPNVSIFLPGNSDQKLIPLAGRDV